MSQSRVLHLFGWDKKFVLPFRGFINEHFADGRHQFIIYGDVTEDDVPESSDTSVMPRVFNNIVALTKAMNKAEKIIIHGLFNNHLLYLLAMQPWLLKKCYWVIWGGDLYIHNAPVKDWRWGKNEFFRRLVIKRMGHLVTYIKGDYDLATEWYGAKGQYHECFMYPSNLYKDYAVPDKQYSGFNILVGNSADLSNNHLEVFDKLEVFKDQDIKIYAPLSYGNQAYAKKIIEEGKKKFGDKFKPLTDMMPFDQYLEFLGLIDVAIFNHKRQQAMGNTITLLGLGKTVYMRSDRTTWELFEDIDVKVFDVENIKLDLLDEKIKKDNQEKIKKHFSIDNYKKQLQELFN
jgi:hypothetical protein